jgi:hypothetical protein
MKPRMSVRQSVLLLACKLHIRRMQDAHSSEQEDYYYRHAIRCLYLATGWNDNQSIGSNLT